MKIVLRLKENPYNLMRQLGYHPEGKDEKTGEWIFAKRLSTSDYPRFHVYLKSESDKIIINLHLDQKRPIYKGTPAHAAEYKGEIIEKEAERIKNLGGPVV